MRELPAQAVLLARSLERADPDGVLLSAEDRLAATEAGRRAGDALEAQAERRAEALLGRVAERVPGVARLLAWTRISVSLAVPVVVVAFVVGLSTNALGPSRHINLLAFPLLGLLVWNLTVYGLLLIAALVGVLRQARRGTPGPAGVRREAGLEAEPGFLASLVWWIGEWTLERVRTPDPAAAEVVSRALASYWSDWTRRGLALGVARLHAFLHLGAAALAVGVVVGMYVRGLALEYRAAWESTFLSADMVAGLLHLVLGPAAALLGATLPEAPALAAMATPKGATAAPWIHLWAITTAGVVVVPRLVLAGAQLVHAARLARAVPVAPIAGSFRALLRPDRGAGVRIDVLPYSHRPGAPPLETLRALLHDLFGIEARVEVRPPVAYGTDRAAPDAQPTCVAVVYGLVQSPESEVHGRYLAEWMEQGGEPKVLAIVDASSWRERFGEDEEQRRAERLRAWDRVLREVGHTPLHVELGRPLAPGAVELAEAALWPEAATAGALEGGPVRAGHRGGR